MQRSHRTKVILTAAFAALLAGGTVGLLAQAGQTAGARDQGERSAPYRSSIQVPDTDHDKDTDSDEEGDGEGEKRGEGRDQAGEDARERTESVQLQALARISADQARAAALAQVPGTAGEVELENEDGNLVYSVAVRTADGERDVKVDAGNGRVLHVERDGDAR